MRARAVDRNQAEIVGHLRGAGATVQDLSGVGGGCPDLLVGFRGRNFLLEIKTPDPGSRLNALQNEWHMAWTGHAAVVRTSDEALREILAVRVIGRAKRTEDKVADWVERCLEAVPPKKQITKSMLREIADGIRNGDWR